MAIHGKSRIGKSRTKQNLDVTLSTIGNKLLLVGSGLKANLARMLLGDLNQIGLPKNPI